MLKSLSTTQLTPLFCRLKFRSDIVIGLIVAASPVLLRLPLITALPFTDEGFYALHSMLAHKSLIEGEGLPPLGVLHFYPTLLSFVFSWDSNPILALRLSDAVVAALVAWQLFRLTSQESGSAVVGGIIALLFTTALNRPLFIDSGFKNAAFAAWLFLLPALRLGLRTEPESVRTFFGVGVLACIGIFFRESCAPLGAAGFLSIRIKKGRRCAIAFAAGGVTAAVTLICLFAYARGGINNIIDAYSEMAVMLVQIGAVIDTLLYLKLTAKELFFLVPTAAAALIMGLYGISAHALRKGHIVFWSAVSFAPLIEILTKGGHPYSFSFALYGFAGLTAYTARLWRTAPRSTALVFLGCLSISLVWGSIPLVQASTKTLQAVTDIARRLPEQQWPAETINSSNYLLMADAITRHSSPEDTLEVSGNYMLLHVLTRRFPPPDKTNHLLDLGHYALVHHFTVDEMQRHLEKHRTNVVILSERPGFNVDVVKDALAGMPQYRAVEYVGKAPRHYGGFTGVVYVRKKNL